MKHMIAVLAFVMVAQAQAQTQVQNQNANTNQQQQEAQASAANTAANSAEAKAIVVPVQPVTATTSPIYIMNTQRVQGYQGTTQTSGQTAGQTTGQEQVAPVTVVRETTPSGAIIVREQRAGAERTTDDSIATALERARLNDEMKRRDRFNGALAQDSVQSGTQSNDSRINGNNNTVSQTNVLPQQTAQTQTQVQAPVTVPAPVQPVQQVPTVIVPDQKIIVIHDEAPRAEPVRPLPVVTEVREEIVKVPEVKEVEPGYTYAAGLLSYSSYDNTEINSNLGGGVAIGVVTSEHVMLEGQFQYSNFEIGNGYNFGSYSNFYGYDNNVDLRQYNVNVAAKYSLFVGKFRPNIGAVIGYTRRNYTLPNQGYYTNNNGQNQYSFATDAFDIGGAAGVDFMLSKAFAIGLDFRYMTNLGYRARDGKLVLNNGDVIENLDYYTIGLVGKFVF